MSADDLPELEPDALAALREAKALVDPGAAVRARMRSRLLTALPPLPDGGGGGEESGGGAEPAPSAPAAPAAGGLPTVPLWTVAAALAIGGAAGLLYPRAPVERIVTAQASPVVAAAPAAPSAVVPVVPAVPVLPSIDTRDLPDAVSPVAALAPASVSGVGVGAGSADLAAERTMLDVARTALGRGNGANALVACDDHARRFPRGALAEEREAIAVQALVIEHRGDDARARAERFRKTHPRSILLPAVLAAAGVEP